MLRRLAQAACAIALMGFSAGASAQDAAVSPPVALDRFNPAPAGDRMFGVQSPYVAGDLTPHISVLADYAHNPLVLRTVNTRQDLGAIVSDQLFLHLNASFAIKQRLLINVAFPIALLQAGAAPKAPGADGPQFISPDSAEIGDLRAGLRLRLLGDYWDPFQLAIGGYIWFPTARSEPGSFVGEGTVRGLPQLILGGRIAERVVWSFDIGPDLRGSQTFGGAGGIAQGTKIRLDGGLGFLLDDARNFQIGPEFSASFEVENKNNTSLERVTNMEVLLDARYRFLHDWEIGAGVGPGLTSGVGTPDVRVIGMVSYSPEMKKEEPPKDTDGDGIMDPQDACPTVKGMLNADPKLNGCPDTDGDGIFDQQDACPTVKGIANADPKLNGCPDTDGDGIFDQDDACPTVKGVPDPDKAKHGCPPDRDGDGVPDAEDACPDIKGIKTNDPATNGCPGDTDGDTIRDDKDACPNEKGKPDPDPKKNGCPEAVRVTDTEVIILQQVQFDTNKATIKKVSDPLLDEVAGVFKDHPELTKIEVQGHTDSRGSAELNKKLSQDRAESVAKALAKRGIAESRMVPKGYGPDRPIGDNKTIEGQTKNRRVQFVILEKVGKDGKTIQVGAQEQPKTVGLPGPQPAPAPAPKKP